MLLETLLTRRILVLDGAMGTMIQPLGLTEKDFRGNRLAAHPVDIQGDNDVLALTQPQIIRDIHEQYLRAGADIITTNTFNSNRFSQSDYELGHLVYELNREAAMLAKVAAQQYATSQKPRFVAGSLGPTGKSASMSPDIQRPGFRAVNFDDFTEVYTEQVQGLMDGGVDILLCETVFDTLNVKAALMAIERVFTKRRTRIPVMVSATITDASGRTLSGQTIEAFLYSVMHVRPLSVGINCSLGAAQMRPYLEELSRCAPFFVSVHPNAGLPNQFGRYDQTPEEMAGIAAEFMTSGFVNIIGGCCGTAPAHIAHIARAAENMPPRKIPRLPKTLRLSGLEQLVAKKNETFSTFINIGERCNVAGSAKFARLIREGNYPEAVNIARAQAENGAQILDVNMDDAMLDAASSVREFLNLLASEPDAARLPVMVDSSRWEAIEAGLKCLQGKSIVNSISLKEGEDIFRTKAELIRAYGAAVAVMAFDEQGQATDYDRRIEICARAYRILTEEVGFPAEDIIFDPNVLTIGTGIREHDNFALDFLMAVKWIKENLPSAKVSGGISNLSFAFRGNNPLREAMHSVFLYHAIRTGLDMGIVNAGVLPVYDDIPVALREALEDLIFNRRPDATDRLLGMAENLKGTVSAAERNTDRWRSLSIEERIKYALVKGITDYMESDMEEARKHYSPTLAIIEGPLMAGINEVGNLFGEGKMFLPQVIKSARAMRYAVNYLQPYVEREKKLRGDTEPAGKILLATVKGDVHDIGKNIVSVVLSCNNYEIIDLGVMTPCEKIIAAAREQRPDIVALSGLITPSLDEMKHVAEEMERAGLTQPLMIGGATTSKIHTALYLTPAYNQPVVHVKDASRSVAVANALLSHDAGFIGQLREEYQRLRENYEQSASIVRKLNLAQARERRLNIDWNAEPPVKPDTTGLTVWNHYPLNEIRRHIDWTYFFMAWQLKGKYPQIFDHPEMGAEARRLFDDANRLLDELIDQRKITANGLFGIFPANSSGDDIEVYHDESRTKTVCVFHNLRNQTFKEGHPNLCLSDFIAPKDSNLNDYIGAFALTAGIGVDALADSYRAKGDDYNAIMSKLLADRLAEAFAECISIRQWAANSKKETLTRVSHGYPACPDHSEKETLFRLLNATQYGMSLTENFAMIPTATVSGLIFAHPQSRSFAVGKITDEQLNDYALRKGIATEQLRKWIALL
ncbi:MAG: methionine synthase [Bacteroidales bacterium]|jgi:5-methyltetrahydrofolate--homocysteine methyltransferase|nr:methionine synthase [Bacteroidales bacterium]